MIGLGYVGLPVAVAFGKHARAIGFDIHTARIAELQAGYDRTGEVTAEDLAATRLHRPFFRYTLENHSTTCSIPCKTKIMRRESLMPFWNLV